MPENFDQTQLSDLFQITKGSICPFLYPDEEFVHHSLPALDATGGPALELGHQIESNKTLLVSPSVLVSKLNPRTSRVTVVDPSTSPKRHCCSTEFIAYTPTQPGLSLGYYSYLFGSDHFRTRLQNIAIGTTNSHVRANPSETLTWQVPYPPKPEQAKIAEVLSVVDRTIEQTERLIAKQQRIKTGLMQDLLTRGVDEQGNLRSERTHSFKNSPLGKIPNEWSFSKLECVGNWASGGTPSKGNSKYWGDEIPWVCPKDMKAFEITSTIDGLTQAGVRHGSRLMPEQTVFIVVRGMILAHTFPVCIANRAMAFNQDVKAIIARPDIVPRFLAYWLVCNADNFLKITTTATHGTKRFDMKELFEVIMPTPEKSEQNRIVTRLDSAEKLIDTNREIVSKFRMLKTGLMKDLLTGKQRVTPLLQSEKLVK